MSVTGWGWDQGGKKGIIWWQLVDGVQDAAPAWPGACVTSEAAQPVDHQCGKDVG